MEIILLICWMQGGWNLNKDLIRADSSTLKRVLEYIFQSLSLGRISNGWSSSLVPLHALGMCVSKATQVLALI